MSFNVTFWTFSKKERSTAQPAGQGTTYSCNANDPLDLLAPVISLNIPLNTSSPPTVYNYARIPNFSRYYWVDSWTVRDGLWQATLRVDVLASWKTAIGSSSIYIYRSSYEFNRRITDTVYPTLTQPEKHVTALPKVWTTGGSNEAGTAAGTYTIIAGIINTSGTKYYAFTPAQWARFYAALFSNQFYEDVLSFYGATEYPEAKVAVNPLQYISSAMMVPLEVAQFPDTDTPYKIPFHQTLLRVPVGSTYVPSVNTGDNICCELADGATSLWSYNMQFSGDVHPQAAARGGWLDYSPYTEYEVFFPPQGTIPLEASLLAEASQLSFATRLDYRAGTGMFEVIAHQDNMTKHFNLYRGEFPIGVPIQLSNVLKTGSNSAYEGFLTGASWLQSSLGTAGESIAMAAGFLPIVGGVWKNGIQSAIHGNIPRSSTKGSYGSLANMGGSPQFVITNWILADDDNAGKGRPLCAVRQISNIPGFITAEADELSISCTDNELTEIRAAVAGGFYYE